MRHDDITYVRHMLDAIDEIQKFLENMTYTDFMNDPKTMYAVVKLIEIVGEATNHLSDDFMKQYPQIPYTKIISMRNYLIHQYAEMDMNAVWDVHDKHLPELQKILRSVLDEQK